ncbi:MAG TPA: asparagine synthase (glutamine-hydrolyzing) [Methanotrichaceae archaeon]|nr:asparagine synthase (glutamine-hydrolyzing) [Methanotrichaceae archaeon]HQF16795.1 asparagine synthase (glutamine-hydrolyzing) [Methanotrichaceae archaeon]HQI90121.1 asparagine synthase (glutamine-hydrolyzing) [Methanotrichaceae archaeon]HQJ27856.1 asparagine synthase (glutamine-hydrolyzing) [Methanotrichaceae archaeon]
MCGINGFSWDDPLLVQSMNGVLRHRGPDDEGTFCDGRATLGHCRLSIIDLSAQGHQPMSNEDKNLWITYNGEIYNFSSIRSELQEMGHRFASRTDTEVIIHSYEQWGPSCVERFNGMWAFALYDQEKGQIFLCRDRFGVKPLYYHHDSRGLIFSSEIKALLPALPSLSAHPRAVYEYLAFGFTDHLRETFLSGVDRLMPGEWMIYDLSTGRIRLNRWYGLPDRLKPGEVPDDPTQQVRSLFLDSVRCRLVSDVAVGSCLSGGIDSSAIVYAMRAVSPKSRIKTFSMVFPGHRLDESRFVEKVVEDVGAESFLVTPSAEELMQDLQDLVWSQEEPFRSISIYGQYRVMRLAHEHGMKVLLDGQGSDELFAGYFIYFKYYLFECLRKGRFDEALAAARAIGYNPSDLVVFPLATLGFRMGLGGLLKYIWNRGLGYLRPFYQGPTSTPFAERGFDLNSALISDLLCYSIPQLLRYEDKNSMRWSVETRVPFLDFRLVELAESLPSGLKIHGGGTKHVLRQALEGLVSSLILGRRDKIGFATPDGDWLSTPEITSIFDEIFASPEFRSRPYWDADRVAAAFQDCKAGRRQSGEQLWRIVNTELWLRAFVDGGHGS